jgi:hypothetical protein
MLHMDVDTEGVAITAVRKDGETERILCKYAFKPIVSKSMMLTDNMEVPTSADPMDPFDLAKVFEPSHRLALRMDELRGILQTAKKSNLTFRAKDQTLSVETTDTLYTSQHFLSCSPNFTYFGTLSSTTLQIVQGALDLVSAARKTKKRTLQEDEVHITLQDDMPVHLSFYSEEFKLSCFFGTQEV